MRLDEALSMLAKRSKKRWEPSDELGRIDTLPGAVGREVVRRLTILAPLFDGSVSVARVDAAAASLGMNRRNVYVLLDRLSELPPVDGVAVRGTSPAKRRRTDPGQAADGGGDLVDRAIGDLLREKPEARLAAYIAAVRSATEGTGRPPPAAKTVSRRLDALRAAGPAETAPICGRILLDESVVNLAIERDGVRQASSISMLVDADTRAILSWGLTDVGDGRAATAAALRAFVEQEADIRRRWAVAGVLRSATLVLPETASRSIGFDPDGVIDVVTAGPRSRGVRLRRVLGVGLGSLLFRPRHDASIGNLPSEDGWQVVDARSAELLVGQAVTDHNAMVRARAAVLGSDSRRSHDALVDAVRIAQDALSALAIVEEDQAGPAPNPPSVRP